MVHPHIVWLASFPKSGNTWFRVLLANLDAGENGPVDINALGIFGPIASDRGEFEKSTLLDSALMFHDEIDSLRPRVYESFSRTFRARSWIKVHDAYTLTVSGEPILGRCAASAAVYLVRDPRDVAVSFARHMDCSIDGSIKLLSSDKLALSAARKKKGPQLRQKLLGWSAHVTSWLDQKDVPVRLVRYEDLVSAPAECFAAALDFVGQVATRADVERAVRHSDFAELQRQERERGFAEHTSRSTPFFHSGRVGGWRNHLTARQADAIVCSHGEVMARLGYELSNAA